MEKAEATEALFVPINSWFKQTLYYLGMVHVIQWFYLTVGEILLDYRYIESLPFINI